MKRLRSSSVSTLLSSRGAQKLGQPVPESYLVSDENRGASHATQRYTPSALLPLYSPLKGRSVPFMRVMRYCSGVSSSCHSSSVFCIFLGVSVMPEFYHAGTCPQSISMTDVA